MSTATMEATGSMAGLSNDMILKLMAGGRARNAYGPKLKLFLDSDEAAINPAEVWPIEFGQKKATTLYQGFNTAIKEAGLNDTVQIKQSDGQVFLLHTERVALLFTQDTDDE
jgi:hypothetical protein